MELNGIDPKQISVIVRGLIVGAPQDDERKKLTKRSLASFRRYLPGAQLILSSWKGSDVSGLDYDDVILSDPPKEIYTARPDGSPKLMTGNNQIVTTLGGLSLAKEPYTLVARSDIALTGTGFLKYFTDFNEDGGAAIKKKVVVLPTYNPRKKTITLLFNVCDWFFFGLTEDIKDIFSIPLMTEDSLVGEKMGGLRPQVENFDAEQYLWSTFLKKHQPINLPYNNYFTNEALEESEKSYATNTIMVPADKAGILCMKMPHAAYGAHPVLSQGLYTFNEYRKMYNTHNDHRTFYVPNPLEDFLYAAALRARLSIKKIGPNFYKRIVNRIRRWNGSNDLYRQ